MTRSQSLRVLLLNARSIRNKFDELRAMLASEDVDVVAITESWIRTGSRDFEGEFMIPGYVMFHKDRLGQEGGGVLAYVRESLHPVDCGVTSGQELLGVDIKVPTGAYRFLLVYRPPHRTEEVDRDLYAKLSELVEGPPTILMGDFNCRVDWSNRTGDGESQRLVDFADDNFLTQWVEEPTRGENILDLVFTTDDELVSDLSVDECLGGSDHNMVRFRVRIPSIQRVDAGHRKVDFRRANFDGLRTALRWLGPLEGEGVCEKWEFFKTRFMGLQAEFVPTRPAIPSNSQPKWYKREIGRKIRDRKVAHRTWKASRSQNDHNKLIDLRRRVKAMVRAAKRSEEIRVASLCKENPKEFFAHVKSRKPVRQRIGPLKDGDGVLRESNQEIADALNVYFSSVYTREREGEVPRPAVRLDEQAPDLSSIRTSVQEVAERIRQLNPYKSPGPDGFLPRVLREVKDEVAPYLAEIFNASLESGVVPLDWRIANVTPIHKKGDRSCADNYRPVSLTSVVGKILEGIIADRVTEHLDLNELISESQHGFRRGRSCLTNLLEFFHEMMSELDRSRCVDILYLDFRKAFDKVPHRRLMAKVRALGIRGDVANWIEKWLSDRQQRVVVDGQSSGWSSVTSGVPQGSVLGPLLFIIYINDVDVGMVSRIAKFADDTKLGGKVASVEDIEKIRADLRRIGEWSDLWQMPFNLDKCKVMHVGYANPQSDYSLQGKRLDVTDVEKDLGVLISSDFKFSKQCVEVEKKAQRLLGYIRRQFSFRNKEIVLSLYNSLVRPHLEYAVQFWSPSLRKDIERLERVQARATKLIPEIRHRNYQTRLRELGLFSLETRRLRGQLIEVFKILRGFEKIDHRKLFTLSQNNTRNHGWKLELPRFRTTLVGNFFTYKVCDTWNRLPESVVNSDTVDQFKKRLDEVIGDLR